MTVCSIALESTASYNWCQAPDWAMWAAVNEDGSANWFLSEPILDESRGRWMLRYEENRSWPMYTTSRLFLGWRGSLLTRPVECTPPPAPTPSPAPCVPEGSTILTDAISYIEAGLGNILIVPDCSNLSV